MKNQIILTIALVMICAIAHSQKRLIPVRKIDTLEISDIKTTHLLFDQKIKYLDVGSPYFVADTTKQMIRLKHIGEELIDIRSQLSNLTVITEDGGYYSMVLAYNRFQNNMTYRIKRTDEFAEAIKTESKSTQKKNEELISLCEKLNRYHNNKLHIKSKNTGDIRTAVAGIFYVDEKIGLRLELKNQSPIDFDLSLIHI